MIHNKLPLSKTTNFPKLFLDYIQKSPQLKDFYGEFPDIEGFKNQIQNRKFSNRETLVNVIKQQYHDIQNPPNIDVLYSDRCFTVTTGHQLNIFTGPLYVIYKIVSTINLAKQLKSEFPEYDFVPVYWMASEDHDLDEIKYFNLFGKKHYWETDQTGAVGRMNPQSIVSIYEETAEIPDFFKDAYASSSTLSEAVRKYMHHLFGEYNLISIDPDHAALKNLFAGTIQREIMDSFSSPLLENQTQKLENLGYKSQISSRDINLFYLENATRNRIEKTNEGYQLIGRDKQFTSDEIQSLIANKSDNFSPNVVLRPLYQETILPNIAYLGGPSEVAYWLQLKQIFDVQNVLFPILLPRNFATIISGANGKKIEKLGITNEELFSDENTISKSYVIRNSSSNLDLSEEYTLLATFFHKLEAKTKVVDPTLSSSVEAEKTKVTNGIENLERKIRKQEEKKHEVALQQIKNLKSKLFPEDGLQERTDNYLNFQISDSEFIHDLFQAFNPLDFQMNILWKK
ncbi:MAG: bacillithiol biosynthesis cysteine-adding enzyme BshC [Leadbetterella sp.]